jgi:hypothetical protein
MKEIKGHFKFFPDNPILYRQRIYLDSYKRQSISIPERVRKILLRRIVMTARQARGKGCLVDSTIDDNSNVTINIERILRDDEDPGNEKVTYSYVYKMEERFLPRRRDKQLAKPIKSHNIRTKRVEIFDAMKYGVLLIEDSKIRDEINLQLNNNEETNVLGINILPKFLVMLGIKESNGDIVTYSRGTYRIKKFSSCNIICFDDANTYELEMSQEVYEKGLQRNLLFFMPSNVEIEIES